MDRAEGVDASHRPKVAMKQAGVAIRRTDQSASIPLVDGYCRFHTPTLVAPPTPVK